MLALHEKAKLAAPIPFEQEVSGEEVVTPDGLRYRDLKVGGGSTPQRGFLIVLDYKAFADGQLFEDTRERGKPIGGCWGSVMPAIHVGCGTAELLA